ncbi:hypothetical protein EGW08_010328, partial [Elysia chlorotica]
MVLTNRHAPFVAHPCHGKRSTYYSPNKQNGFSYVFLGIFLAASVLIDGISAGDGVLTTATQLPPTLTTSSLPPSAAAATFQPRSARDEAASSSLPATHTGPSLEGPGPVVELLDASLLQRARGVTRHSPTGWHLSHDFPGISLDGHSGGAIGGDTNVLGLFQGSLAFRFSGILTKQSQGALLRVSSRDAGGPGTLPKLEIYVDLTSGDLVLRYLGFRSFQRMILPGVFLKQRWMDLGISIDGKKVNVTVDCQKTSTFSLRQPIGALPPDAVLSFGAKQTGHNGLQGIVFSAKLFPTSHVLPDACQPYTKSSDLELPPLIEVPSTQRDDSQVEQKRLLALEQKFVELALTVESLQSENAELRTRVAHLETCECRPSCNHQGAPIQEGGTWSPEPCTLCTCVNNAASCAPRKDVASCTDPCLSSPCQNSGECLRDEGTSVSTETARPSYRCECPPPYDGPACEVRQNPCVWPADPGTCDQAINRFYYDILSQQCLPFIFSGCGGNVNNYYNIEECTSIALTGACCSRSYNTSIQAVQNSSSCDSEEQRWFYNQRTRRCEQFTYLGCRGNANNFRSIDECQSRCVKGSCCSRRPKIPALTIGFDTQGFDRYGFNSEGLNRFGDRRTVDNSSPTGKNRYDRDGFDWEGFDRLGYDGKGLNRAGYNREGFDEEGFNITGYSRIGEFDGIIDYDEEGYDAEGYNRAGLSCHGYDRKGLDIYSANSAFEYRCEMTTETRCYEKAKNEENIVKFTPGKTCPERGCDLPCHCRHGNQTYTVYQKFYQGCQLCECTETGLVRCQCSKTFRRKEVREMSGKEMDRYQAAVRTLTQGPDYPSRWFQLAALY